MGDGRSNGLPVTGGAVWGREIRTHTVLSWDLSCQYVSYDANLA